MNINEEVKLKVHYENSRYEGAPLFQPRIPYLFIPSPRKVDKSLPFLKRFGSKLKLIGLDLKDYLMDIVLLKGDKFSFKTADFTKRNYHKFSHAMYHIWIELKNVGYGFKLLNDDFKFYVKV